MGHDKINTTMIAAKVHAYLLRVNSWSCRLYITVIPFCVVAYFSYLTRNYQLDDALIYSRYLKNFHDGFGLVYNPGEKFNGLTSPLFTFISLAASFLFSSIQSSIIIISAVFLTCASILGGKIFSQGKWESLFTAIVIGSFGYFYSTFGMETPLFLMLIALSLYLYKINSEYFIIALALLIITRSEGVFLGAILAVDYLIKKRSLPDARILLLSMAILLLPFVFNYLYYGDFLPASASAKIGQGKSGFWGGKLSFLNFEYLVKAEFYNDNIPILFLLGASVCGVFISLKDRIAVVTVMFFAALLCFYVGLKIPNYPWYYAPFFYLILIFACRGIWGLSTKLLSKGYFNYRVIFVLVLCAATIFALAKVISFRERGLGRYEAYARIGIWIEQNTASNASVAMVEIGTVGWYANRKIIDILGLVNKYNADYIGKGDVYGWLSHYQPDYILRHDPMWEVEKSTILLQSNNIYEPMQSFNFPRYVLLKKTDKYSNEKIAKFFREKSTGLAH